MARFLTRARKRHRTLFFLLPLGGILFILGSSAWAAYTLLRGLPDPARITDRAVVESTKIYDRTGKVLLYEIHGEEKRTVIPFNQIPDTVKETTLVAEDENFYQHTGIDIKGIFRATYHNILNGNFSQGGSTITQQLIKNSLLGPEKTITRKIREQILAVLLEQKYSKDQILELYLNQIPYGSNAYGIAAASETYFAKPPNDLTLAEAAMLASLLKAPTHYSPYGSHKDELLGRRNWVLDRMADAGFATPEAAAIAKKTPLTVVPSHESIRAPHFVMYVREYLNETYGEQFIEQGGLRVITSLDWNLQEEAEKIIKDGAEQNEKTVHAANASLVAIDPRTGGILAMVGSRDYWSESKPNNCTPGLNCTFDPHVNVATRLRQPGSSFKPFVYATAFKKGYTPETILFDAPTEFNPHCGPDGLPGPLVTNPKDCYSPNDYDGSFRGPVTIRQALAQSLNIPSVKLLYLAGIKDSIQTATDMGITSLTEPDRYGLSLVLGGAEVSLLEMTSAYGVFSQDGILHPKTAILRVENSQGVILEEHKDASLPVLDTEVARTINNILSDNSARVPVFSARSSLYFPDRQVAAKTGTTQESRDAWVIGYTPSLVVGVWAGNNDNTSMNKTALSVLVAAPLWHTFLNYALANKPPEEFIPPEPRISDKPVFRGLYRSGPIAKVDKVSGKLATPYTPPELVSEIATGNVRTILTFINKDDPLGDPPSDPPQDPQYQNWQAGINQWLSIHSLPAPRVPEQFDDLHTPDKQPKIRFLSPLEGVETVPALSDISVAVETPFPLREISLFVNDGFIQSKTNIIAPGRVTFHLDNNLAPGVHTIKITAYDAVGNKGAVTRDITLTSTE